MPSSPNQKLKLLYLMKILLERSDEDGALTMQQIIAALSEYHINAERKSIYSDIELLRQFGIDIETHKSKTVSYYVGEREFELPELKLLVDAVQSSHFITTKKSRKLIKKLSALTSISQAKQLNRQVVIAERPKTINENVYYSIDAIHVAINEKCKICFKYFDYDVDKQRIYRKEGKLYSQTPVALCWNDDKYYLICYSEKYRDFTHFRVDRMENVKICDEPADAFDESQFNVGDYTKKFFGMYGGDIVKATLWFDSSLVSTVLDKFGAEVPLCKDGDAFKIHVEVSNSPVFLSWIFQFGEKAAILGPESLKSSMQELILKGLKNC